MKDLPQLITIYHDEYLKNGRESDILLSGKYRTSLLGVQMMVLV